MADAASSLASSAWTTLTALFSSHSPAPRTVVLASWTFATFRFATTVDVRSGPRVYRLQPVFAGMTAEECDVMLEQLALLAKRDAVLELSVVDDPEVGRGVNGRVVRLRAKGSPGALYRE